MSAEKVVFLPIGSEEEYVKLIYSPTAYTNRNNYQDGFQVYECEDFFKEFRSSNMDDELISLIREHVKQNGNKEGDPCNGCPCKGKGVNCTRYCPDIGPFFMKIQSEPSDAECPPCAGCCYNYKDKSICSKYCSRLKTYQNSNSVNRFARTDTRNGGRRLSRPALS